MSLLQWLGVWGMTGFSAPEKIDLNKWTKGIDRVLKEEKGQHYLRKFLKECGLEKHAKILELWIRCDNLINQGASGNLNEAQEILAEAKQYLTVNDQDAVNSQIVALIRELAEDSLKDVLEDFIKYLDK